MPVRWLSPHPHGRDFLLDGIAATQKDQSFILRVRKYELRVAEPFILCRTLVPIMTAAYYISSPGTGNCNFIVFFIIPYLPETFSSTMYVNLIMSRTTTSLYTDCSHNPYAGLSFYSPCPSRHTLNVLKMIFQSTQKLRSFTYLMSRSIHSSKERSLRCGAICQ